MNILYLAYYYPPMGGAAVQRALKFTKFLPAFGVQPTVLAAEDPHYVHDASLAGEIPAGLAVHRIVHTPLLAALVSRRRAFAGGGATVAGAAPSTRWRAAARDALLSGWRALEWPDDKAGWARRAAGRARRLMREQAFDLVFSSSPPFSVHRLAARLAREFDLPWVADLRDLWTDNPAYDMPRWRAWIDRHWERALLGQAEGIVTVTQTWADMLGAAYRRAGRPAAFIPNGYDETDFQGLVGGRPPDGLFRLAHTGTFYGPRDPAGLLQGVGRFLEAGQPGCERLRLRLVGNMGARFDEPLAAFERRHPGVIERVPYLPHREALQEMLAADALLLVVGGAPGAPAAVQGWLPGKIFEYLRARRPILLLGAVRGEAAAIVRDCAAGLAVEDNDAAGIAQALARLVGASAVPPPAVRSIESFERRALAGQLAGFLQQCRLEFQAHARARP